MPIFLAAKYLPSPQFKKPDLLDIVPGLLKPVFLMILARWSICSGVCLLRFLGLSLMSLSGTSTISFASIRSVFKASSFRAWIVGLCRVYTISVVVKIKVRNTSQ